MLMEGHPKALQSTKNVCKIGKEKRKSTACPKTFSFAIIEGIMNFTGEMQARSPCPEVQGRLGDATGQ